MLSYQMEKDTIDGKKTIIQNPTDKQRQEHEKVIQNILYLIENIFTKKSNTTWCTTNRPVFRQALLG